MTFTTASTRRAREYTAAEFVVSATIRLNNRVKLRGPSVPDTGYIRYPMRNIVMAVTPSDTKIKAVEMSLDSFGVVEPVS